MICDMADSMIQPYLSRQDELDSVVLPNCHIERSAYACHVRFGARLAAMRKLRGMTQTDLGKGLGTDGADVGKQVVYGWEKDQHYPRVDQLMQICEKLSCSADYLLFGAGAMTISPKYLAAQRAVSLLTQEERLNLLATLAVPRPDETQKPQSTPPP